MTEPKHSSQESRTAASGGATRCLPHPLGSRTPTASLSSTTSTAAAASSRGRGGDLELAVPGIAARDAREAPGAASRRARGRAAARLDETLAGWRARGLLVCEGRRRWLTWRLPASEPELSYCFAGAYLATSRDQGAAFIDAAAFEQRLDFLERSGIPEARLIGGEPTLHPAFPDLVAAARSRGLRITVFSHGLMPRRRSIAWPSCRPTRAPCW